MTKFEHIQKRYLNLKWIKYSPFGTLYHVITDIKQTIPDYNCRVEFIVHFKTHIYGTDEKIDIKEHSGYIDDIFFREITIKNVFDEERHKTNLEVQKYYNVGVDFFP